jgi:hypothetical protein
VGSVTVMGVIHTFGLSHDRKTTFGILGRGHLGVLGEVLAVWVAAAILSGW